jgi:hypothetical protein
MDTLSLHRQGFALGLISTLLLLASCTAGTPASDKQVPNGSPTLQISIDAKDFMPTDTIEVAIDSSRTLTNLLRSCKEMQFSLKKYEGLGHLVTGINGLENEEKSGHYWQCCLDGTYSDRGVDEIIPAQGMMVSWYYRAYGESPCKKIGEE